MLYGRFSVDVGPTREQSIPIPVTLEWLLPEPKSIVCVLVFITLVKQPSAVDSDSNSLDAPVMSQ